MIVSDAFQSILPSCFILLLLKRYAAQVSLCPEQSLALPVRRAPRIPLGGGRPIVGAQWSLRPSLSVARSPLVPRRAELCGRGEMNSNFLWRRNPLPILPCSMLLCWLVVTSGSSLLCKNALGLYYYFYLVLFTFILLLLKELLAQRCRLEKARHCFKDIFACIVNHKCYKVKKIRQTCIYCQWLHMLVLMICTCSMGNYKIPLLQKSHISINSTKK